MPQILMMNHAAYVNKQRQDIRLKQNEHSDSVHDRVESAINANDVVWKGKRFDEMNSDEMAEYYMS